MPRTVVVRRSSIHGKGVFAMQDMPAGHRVIEYRGALVTHDEANELHDGGVETGHTFLFTLNDQYIIDGTRRGNAARWINHSCSPNCEAVIVEHPGRDRRRDRIFIDTIRAIRPDEELSYDYGIKLDVRHSRRLKRLWACRCGAIDCSGTLLKPRR